jgi:F-type H+-transporting ATPase subunit b
VISLDYSLGIQIVNFLVLIFILNRLLYKPILGMIAKRKRQLAEAEMEIRQLRKIVNEQMAAYEEKIKQAKGEALEQKKAIIGQGAAEAAATITAVRGELPGMMEQYQARMGEQMAAAREILAGRAGDLAREIAEKVLGRSLR